MRIEQTVTNLTQNKDYFNTILLKQFKKELEDTNDVMKDTTINLETFGSVVKLTVKYKFDNPYYNDTETVKEEYLICEIGEEENDDVKLAKALRIIYERFAEQVVNNVLIEN